MEHPEYMNADTVKAIENYLSLQDPPGLILQGIPGLGKSMASRHIAAMLLHCEENRLSENLDYRSTQESEAMKVEDIEHVLAESHRCSIGQRKVFVINNAHTITPGTQNRLLKLLEDHASKNILILISAENRLLDTVKSRCHAITFHPLSERKMKLYLGSLGVEEKYRDFVSYLTENAPYSLDSYTQEIKSYIQTRQQMERISMREDLYHVFHALKEKDSLEFYSTHQTHPAWNIRLLLYPFYQAVWDLAGAPASLEAAPFHSLYTKRHALKILEHGLEHLHMLPASYTKNDYFNLLRWIVQVR